MKMNRLFISLLIFLLAISCGPKTQPAPGETWTQLASMPTERSENTGAVIDQSIYVLGGTDGADAISNQV